MRYLSCSVCLLIALVGCGSGTSDKPAQKSKGTKDQNAPHRLEIPSTLPSVGEPVTSVEGPPRLEVPTPKDWMRQSRRDGILVWWIAQEGSSYPRIYLRAKRSEESNFTSENIEETWDAFSKRDDEQYEVVPIEPVPWLLSQKKTKSSKGFPLSKETYITVVDGWEYSLEMLTPPDEEDRYRPALLSVAKALNFPSDVENQEN